MQTDTAVALPRIPAGSEPLQIEEIEVRTVRLPLNEPFETSFGRIESRLIFLVAVTGAGLTGWGEVVAAEEPRYSYETAGTARHVIRDYLAPAMLARPLTDLADLGERFAPFRGHNMAKAGLELAYMDLLARVRGVSLSQLIGGTRPAIAVGVSLGIQSTLDQLLQRVDRYLALGYQRIKLKIKPGWDVDVVRAVRRRHPDILLSVDANSAYRIEDLPHLQELDELGLLMIEQPLDHDDLLDHARMQSELKTPICLDESITSARRARQALDLGSCQIINIKIGRVGGYSEALAIHDLCFAKGVPVWCGGMLESGIGRAHNIALASLPGFTLPGDISASSRYFARDVIVPPVTVSANGFVEVPHGAGLGFDVDRSYLEANTEQVERSKIKTPTA
ncbi:MAG TPA: o-succinylbenzoate synthase [Pyrinomonadaceae bacterium]|nr:o-succinylbenzoate synthase [Pyrinomonadaceae bacterium]